MGRDHQTAETEGGGKARQDHPPARGGGEHRRLFPALSPLPPPVYDDDSVLDPSPGDEGQEDAVGQVEIDPEGVHEAEGPDRACQQGGQGEQGGFELPHHGQQEEEHEEDGEQGG